jgi:hypothetical protein
MYFFEINDQSMQDFKILSTRPLNYCKVWILKTYFGKNVDKSSRKQVLFLLSYEITKFHT